MALQPVLNPTFTGSTNNATSWTETVGATDGTGAWSIGGGGGPIAHTDNYGAAGIAAPSPYNSMSQTIAGGVIGGSTITFTTGWNNGGEPNGSSDGNQAQLSVFYNNVEYARLSTSTRLGGGVRAAPGPTNGSTFAALNGATLQQIAGNWQTLPNGTGVTFRITLPVGVIANGALRFGARRAQSATGVSATDDIRLTNVTIASPTVCLVKTTNRQESAKGFVYGLANLDADLATAGIQSTPTVVTFAANTPTGYDAWSGSTAASNGVEPMLVLNQAIETRITETATGVYRVTDIACTGAFIAPTYDVAAGEVRIPGGGVSALSPVTCTFTNSRPRVRLQKQLPNGRIASTDQFALSVAGTETAIAATRTTSTTGSGSTANGTADFANADTATNYTLSETMAAGSASAIGAYTTSYSCTNATAGTATVMPSGNGNSFSLSNLAALDDITCVFSNRTSSADLSITKTNTPGVNGNVDQGSDIVVSGTPTTYQLRVTNNGADAATGAVVRDTPGAGITCPAGNTVTITGDGVPVGAFTIANLTGSGITLGTLATGQTAVLSFSCNVQ